MSELTTEGKCALVTLLHVSTCQLVLIPGLFLGQGKAWPLFALIPPPIPGMVGGIGCGLAENNSCPIEQVA